MFAQDIDVDRDDCEPQDLVILESSEEESTEPRVFPCLSNQEARLALRMLMNTPQITVEVAGGILRHNIR